MGDCKQYKNMPWFEVDLVQIVYNRSVVTNDGVRNPNFS